MLIIQDGVYITSVGCSSCILVPKEVCVQRETFNVDIWRRSWPYVTPQIDYLVHFQALVKN